MYSYIIKINKKVLGFILIFISIAISAFSQDSLNVKKHTYKQKKFERKMQMPDVQLLDVRTETEFNVGRLPNALLMDVEKDDFNGKIKRLDKEKTYLIYCKSGRRSEKAAKLMYNAGFKKVYHLKGGYIRWRGEKVQESKG